MKNSSLVAVPSQTISFGCCIYPGQGIDWIGFVDVLTNLAPSDVKKFGHLVPGVNLQSLLDVSLDIKFHWVSFNMEPVKLTGGVILQPTCSYNSCPPLDYLLIGGPDPDVAVSSSEELVNLRRFVQERAPSVRKIFTTCTGALTLASTGLLAGHKATVNHAFITIAKTWFPDVHWNVDRHWVEDGIFWTASGALAGMDMAGHWVRQQASEDLLHLSTILLDWTPRNALGQTMSHYNSQGKYITESG